MKLRTLQLHVQENCNFSCNHCSHGSPNAKYKSNNYVQFLESLWRMSYKGIAVNQLDLLGGEPFLHKDFNGFIEGLVEDMPELYTNIQIAVFSNGFWLPHWEKFYGALSVMNSLVITIHEELKLSPNEIGVLIRKIKSVHEHLKVRIDLIDQFEELNFLDEPLTRATCKPCIQLKANGMIAKCHLIAYSKDIDYATTQAFRDRLHEGVIKVEDMTDEWISTLHSCCDFCMYNRSMNGAIRHLDVDAYRDLDDNKNIIRRSK